MTRQQVRQPIRRLIELVIGQGQTAAAQRHRPGSTSDLCGERRRNRHRRGRGPGQHRAVAPPVEFGVLTGVEQIHRRQRPPRVGGHQRQQRLQSPNQRLDTSRIEQVGAKVDTNTQFASRRCLHDEWVVGAFAAGDAGDDELVVAQERGDVDRVVLVHEKGVEQPLLTGDAVDVTQRQLLVLERVVVGMLQPAQQFCGGSCRRHVRPHRHRVDEQSDHRFGPGQLGRPARDRGTEGDVVVAGQPHQQLRPHTLQHDVDGGVAQARQLVESARGGDGNPARNRAARAQPQPIRRTDQCRGVKAGEYLPPRCPGGSVAPAVPIGQPAEKPAIWRGRGQPPPVITGEYFPQQDRHRPAVNHDVVIGEDQPVPVCCGADDSGSKRQLVSDIADGGAFSRAHLPDLLLGVQLDIPPGHRWVLRDDLHRLVEACAEAGHQVGMAGDHCLHRIAQAVDV